MVSKSSFPPAQRGFILNQNLKPMLLAITAWIWVSRVPQMPKRSFWNIQGETGKELPKNHRQGYLPTLLSLVEAASHLTGLFSNFLLLEKILQWIMMCKYPLIYLQVFQNFRIGIADSKSMLWICYSCIYCPVIFY